MIRRHVQCVWLLVAVVLALVTAAATVDQAKVLCLASSDIAYLDPQQISDLASTPVANVLFEGKGSR